jgi:hypothetical protein
MGVSNLEKPGKDSSACRNGGYGCCRRRGRCISFVRTGRAAYSIARDGVITEVGSAGDGQTALCWVTAVDGYFYGSNAGSADVSQFGETSSGVPDLVGVAASLSSGATDSAASSDGRYIYVEEGGVGMVGEFQIGPAGALAQVGEVSGLSAPMEGIVAS